MNLHLSLTSPLPLEDLIAEVDLEGGGAARIRLEKGWFEGDVPGRPTKIRGVLAGAEGALPSSRRRPADVAPASSRPVDVARLFDEGIDVPADGRLDLEILWLAPCDGAPPDAPEGTRFGSFEHTLCAKLVGKADDGATTLQLGAVIAPFDHETELLVGGKPLVFGEIIALAGDYYAHLDDRAAHDFSWAWPAIPGLSGWLAGDYRATTLAGDSQEAVDAIYDHIHREVVGASTGALASALEAVATKFSTRRYLALASQNICHFACQVDGYSEVGNPALALYRAYHRRAREEARAAGEMASREALFQALVVDAFGCHFLTDLFASGHIRVPRDRLGERFGITRGALVMSKLAHDEDNREGLWVTPLRPVPDERRLVWRAFGDDALQKNEAATHLAIIQEAVRRSTAEVFAHYCAGIDGEPPRPVPSAEALVPVPLPPGESPDPVNDQGWRGADLPDFPPNTPPRFRLDERGRMTVRAGNTYLPVEVWAPEAAPGIAVPS